MKHKFFVAALSVSICGSIGIADTVELMTGDLLHGTVTEQTENTVVINHPVLGQVTLPKDQVKGVLIVSDEASAAPTAQPQPAKETIQEISKLSEQLLPGWDKHLELGFTGTDGNTQTSSISTGFSALRENDEERSKLGLKYFRSDDDGAKTRNEASGEIVQDWLMPGSPWFKFATAKLEYDEFKDWQTRASVFGGIGKQIIKGDKNSLIGRAGLGGSYEFDSINELVPEAMLGLEWAYTINDHQSLTSFVTVFPDLDEFGQSRTLAGAAWIIKIDQADGMSLKLGIVNEYESNTEGDSKHNDVKYYGALVFDF